MDLTSESLRKLCGDVLTSRGLHNWDVYATAEPEAMVQGEWAADTAVNLRFDLRPHDRRYFNVWFRLRHDEQSTDALRLALLNRLNELDV